MPSASARKKIQNFSYGLSDIIGKGYSSQVFSGRSDQTGEKVAVKVIDMKMLKNQINQILLQSEIAILRQLKNLQNILSVHEIYTTKNNTYIITELCHTDLNKLIKNKLSEEEACRFMQQIIHGYLQFANRDIIHRDLKPANILVTEDRTLKIADFGFAIKLDDAAKNNKYNVGSPLYMAPESLKKNQYTLKTDIWALGIIFYELLTGQTPWKAKNQKQLIRNIQSEDIDKILEKMTIKDSSKLFLRNTLKIDKSQRIGLDGVSKFRFQERIERVLSDKPTNISLAIKGSTKSEISINIVSPTSKQNCIQNKLFQKVDVKKLTKDNSFQNFSLFHHQQSVNLSMQLKPATTERQNLTSDPKKTLVNKNSENPELLKEDSLTSRDQKCDKKKISKILIAQIHFCRFLYKLLQRLIQSQKNGVLSEPNNEIKGVLSDFQAMISYKLQKLLTFKTTNFINVPGYEEYKQSSDFPKIIKIAEEYKERYSSEFKTGWATKKCTFSTHSTLSLIHLLSMLLEQSEKEEDFVKKFSKDIIALDYLITAKQLIQMLQNGQNYDRFADKSRIEEIVQGKTASISWGLYRRIMERSKFLGTYKGQKQEGCLKPSDVLVQVY